MNRKPPNQFDLMHTRPASRLTRRQFLKQTGRAAAATGILSFVPGWASAAAQELNRRPLRVALIATEVRRHSHAQHFIDRFLEGYGWQGQHYHPGTRLVSLYVDQVPAGDLSRDRSARFRVPIYPTIAECLTLGTSRLAVDGVVLIAEHGRYPRNEMGQTLYPRYRFYKEIVKVFEDSGRSVPVFNDKHLSTNWAECVEMLADAQRLGFALLAGSSLPVTWRIPALEIPLATPMLESVCACYGGVDSYDFHGLETAQCMSERRAGGEKGIRSVTALKGEALWQALAQRESTRELLWAALSRSHTLKPRPGFTYPVPDLDWVRSASPGATGYFIEHRDGFQTSMFLLNGLVQDFTYGGRTRSGRMYSCQMHLPMPNRISTTADFFNPLLHHIEQTIVRRSASYPAERTLLTSGMTLAAVESLHRGGQQVETPEMRVSYRPVKTSLFWNA
jgi:hypothetical protein